MTAKRSITETPNALTADIDLASPIEIVRLLRSTDAQIFAGYGGYPGLWDPETIETLARLAVVAARILRSPRGRVVLSGAGTSGRLAMFTARTFNELATLPDSPAPCDTFRYTIAGTDLALIAAQEGAEDDPHQGIRDLEAAAKGADEIFYVGITCGFSAPYIAGQLEHMISGRLKGHAVLLGFNPVELSRNTPIEGWPGTFLDVARRAAEAENATVLNPVVGPEPITGSTRMKSGSATKILLELLFHSARAAALEQEGADEEELVGALIPFIRMMLGDYENAVREAYIPVHEIARLVEAGGETLRAGGKIYYLGATGPEPVHTCADEECGHDPEDHEEIVVSTEAGILGLIDASECPPTYGADFEDVRGYLADGWAALLPGSGTDLSGQGSPFRISLDDFRRDKLATLSPNDLVVFLGTWEERDGLLQEVKAKGVRTGAVYLLQTGDEPEADLLVPLLPTLSTISTNAGAEEEEEHDHDHDHDHGYQGPPEILSGPTQLAFKLVLNALTTGAHVLVGKVYGNRMVDLRISNNKLFHRTVGIISDLMGVGHEEATMALLRSVYETDSLTEAQRQAPISEAIETSKNVDKVVPKALLLATGRFTYAEATQALARNPIVRAAIGEYVKK